jgi:hypothetical protein
VLEFARTGSAAGAVSSQVLSLVAGVANTMTTNKIPLIAALAVSLCLMGGAGTVYLAAQDGKAPAKVADKGKVPPPAADREPKEPEAPPDAPKSKPPAASKTETKPATSEEIHALLRKPAALKEPLDQMPLRELLEYITDRFNVPVRIDIAAFARVAYPNPIQMYEVPVKLPVVRGMSVGDVLRDALAQIPSAGGEGGGGSPSPATFRIRDGQILIVPAFVTPFSSVGSGPPPGGAEDAPVLDGKTMLEQTEGEPIALSVEEKPFSEVLKELRRMTGANIVLDARQKDKSKLAITADLHDVRLLAALRVLCDMCELQPVSLNNIYYITSKENAERLQKELDRKRWGEPYQLNPFGNGLGGIGIPSIGCPPTPPTKAQPPKPAEKK